MVKKPISPVDNIVLIFQEKEREKLVRTTVYILVAPDIKVRWLGWGLLLNGLHELICKHLAGTTNGQKD